MPRTNYSVSEYLRDLCILGGSVSRGVNTNRFEHTRTKLEILVQNGITHLRGGRGIYLEGLTEGDLKDYAIRIHNAWNFYKERPKTCREPIIRKPGESDNNYLRRLQTTNGIIENLIIGLRTIREYKDEVGRLQNALDVNNERIAELLPTELNEDIEADTGVINRPVSGTGVQGVLFEGLRQRSLAHAGAIKGGYYEERKYRERVGKRKLRRGL